MFTLATITKNEYILFRYKTHRCPQQRACSEHSEPGNWYFPNFHKDLAVPFQKHIMAGKLQLTETEQPQTVLAPVEEDVQRNDCSLCFQIYLSPY